MRMTLFPLPLLSSSWVIETSKMEYLTNQLGKAARLRDSQKSSFRLPQRQYLRLGLVDLLRLVFPSHSRSTNLTGQIRSH